MNEENLKKELDEVTPMYEYKVIRICLHCGLPTLHRVQIPKDLHKVKNYKREAPVCLSCNTIYDHSKLKSELQINTLLQTNLNKYVKYSRLQRNDTCLCGSGKKFKYCCKHLIEK